MAYLLHIFDLGIKFLVPATVWTLVIVGLLQLVHESIPKPGMTSHQVASEGPSR